MPRGFWFVCVALSFSCRVYAAELHWDAPEGCPDVHALQQEAERALSGPLAKYPLVVTGSVKQAGSQLSLSLRIVAPAPHSAETRERELQAATCQELLEAAAVAIALAAADSGEPVAVVQASDDEPRSRPPPPTAEVDSAEPAELALSAAGASNWGALPQIGLGAELQLAWMLRWLRVGLGVTWFPLRSMELNDQTQASFGMYFAEALLCGQQRFGRAHLFGCATAGLGQLSGHLDGLGPVRTQSTPWRAAGLLVGGSYPVLPPLELTASLAAWRPLTRPRFYVLPNSEQVVHEPAPVVAQLLFGLLFSL